MDAQTIMATFSADAEGKITLTQQQLVALLSSTEKQPYSSKKSKTSTASKKNKDPNAPTRPKSAYLIWLWAPDVGVAQVKKEKPDIKHKDALAEASKVWKSLTEEQLATWQQTASQDKTRYEREMASYTPSSQPHTIDAPPAPQNWSGPFQAKYIKGHPVDKEGLLGEPGKKISTKFNDFQEAVQKATTLGLACSGITRAKNGTYTLRSVVDLLTSPKGEISWTTTPPEMPQLVQSTTPATQPPTETNQPQSEQDKTIFGSDEEDSVNEEVVNEEVVNEEVVNEEVANEEVVNEGDHEDDDEDEEDDDDEEAVEVEEITHEGTTYMYCEEDSKIYNEESEHVANMIDGTFTFI